MRGGVICWLCCVVFFLSSFLSFFLLFGWLGGWMVGFLDGWLAGCHFPLSFLFLKISFVRSYPFFLSSFLIISLFVSFLPSFFLYFLSVFLAYLNATNLKICNLLDTVCGLYSIPSCSLKISVLNTHQSLSKPRFTCQALQTQNEKLNCIHTYT